MFLSQLEERQMRKSIQIVDPNTGARFANATCNSACKSSSCLGFTPQLVRLGRVGFMFKMPR